MSYWVAADSRYLFYQRACSNISLLLAMGREEDLHGLRGKIPTLQQHPPVIPPLPVPPA